MNNKNASEKLMDAYDAADGKAKEKLREVIISEMGNSATYYPIVTRPWYPIYPDWPKYPTITWNGKDTGGNVTTLPYNNGGSNTAEVHIG